MRAVAGHAPGGGGKTGLAGGWGAPHPDGLTCPWLGVEAAWRQARRARSLSSALRHRHFGGFCGMKEAGTGLSPDRLRSQNPGLGHPHPHPEWSKGAKGDNSPGCKPVNPYLLLLLRLLLHVQAVWPGSNAGEPRSCYPILKDREGRGSCFSLPGLRNGNCHPTLNSQAGSPITA